MVRIFALLLALAAAAPASAQACREIRFAPGAYSGEVAGRVGAEGAACYSFDAAPGQTVTLEVFGDPNVAFTIPRAVENRRQARYVTGGGRTEILVYQNLYRPGTIADFSLVLSIR